MVLWSRVFLEQTVGKIRPPARSLKCQTERGLTRGEGEEVEGHVCQGDNSQHAVVSVGLNKIVTGDGCGVDVVFSERTYEGLQRASRNQPKHSLDFKVGALPFQRWAAPPIPKCRPPSERILKQSLP